MLGSVIAVVGVFVVSPFAELTELTMVAGASVVINRLVGVIVKLGPVVEVTYLLVDDEDGMSVDRNILPVGLYCDWSKDPDGDE